MTISKNVSTALLAGVFMIALSACDRQGPFEEAGEEIDERAEDTRDAIEDATNGG